MKYTKKFMLVDAICLAVLLPGVIEGLRFSYLVFGIVLGIVIVKILVNDLYKLMKEREVLSDELIAVQGKLLGKIMTHIDEVEKKREQTNNLLKQPTKN